MTRRSATRVDWKGGEDLCRALVESSIDAILLLFSNNWRGLDFIDRVLPKGRYVLGLPLAGGAIANDVLDGALEGRVVLGSSTRGQPTQPDVEAAAGKSLDVVADLFRSAGFEPDVQTNMEHWYWVHFASTAAYTAAASKAGGFPAFAHSTRAIREALAAGREAMHICRARGVDVGHLEEARPFLSPPLLTAPIMRRVITRDVTRRMTQTRPDSIPSRRVRLRSTRSARAKRRRRRAERLRGARHWTTASPPAASMAPSPWGDDLLPSGFRYFTIGAQPHRGRSPRTPKDLAT